MVRRIGSLAIASLGLIAADAPDPALKRQPGSWRQEVTVVRLGVDPTMKHDLQAMFDTLRDASVCVSPAQSAGEDMLKRYETLGGGVGDCTFDRRTVDGGRIDVAGTCRDGQRMMLMTITGVVSPVRQHVTLAVSPSVPDPKTGNAEFHIVATRLGECSAKDLPGDEEPTPE